MTTLLSRRLAALTGLLLAACVALWWLASTRLALDRGADASRHAADALQALWLTRALVLALLGVRLGAMGGWRTGALATTALAAPAWPVVLLAWSASTLPWAHAALAEATLLAAALLTPWIGLGLRRFLRANGTADLLGTGLGAALAAVVWLTRGLWAWPLA